MIGGKLNVLVFVYFVALFVDYSGENIKET